MSNKVHSQWRAILCRLAIAAVLPMKTSFPAVATSSTPIKVVDRGSRSEWMEASGWGGGVAFVFGLKHGIAKDAPSLHFLAGGAPEFTFGCTSRDESKSHWRFRVGATPPGQGISGEDEMAHEQGMAHYFGAAGMLILFDEMDKEMRRFPLLPKYGALETDRLTPDDVQSFRDASAIRAETPRLIFESGTINLHGALNKMPKLPCAAR